MCRAVGWDSADSLDGTHDDWREPACVADVDRIGMLNGQLRPSTRSDSGRSAHVGHAYLTLGNKNVRWRTSAALGAVREGAVHRLLDGCTQGTCVRAQLKTRPQNSHVVKLERCAKLTNLADASRGLKWPEKQ